ncbi:alpha/beta hydrolase [Microbispora sp. NPDC049125]|uniref:alpha/beta hydrolase n=1 Tax=Microbispora sp. NPDC049125 TaxID=3154929 RepID=UPI00346622D0
MELTASGPQVLLAVLAVAGMAVTVWVWPRLSAPSWRTVAARVGLLLANQALILLGIAVAANAYFGFYGSWGDLLGTDDGAPAIANGDERVARVSVLGSTPVVVTPKTGPKAGLPAGRLEQVVISGAATGLSSPAYVYLPPQYFDKKFAGRRFPAILGLTGYPGDAVNLVTRLNIPVAAATAILSHQIAPTILVLMRPTVAPPRDTECVDVPDGPQVETFFTKDVPRSMATGFRVGTGAASWGVLGESTGGYCALKMSMRHPEAFSAAASLSGYFHAVTDVTSGDLFGGSQARRDENDLMWRLAHLPAPPISVLVTSSRVGEEADYAATQLFLAAVKPPMRAASLILPSGGHNFATWNREIPQALPWLAQQLHAPAPNTQAAGRDAKAAPAAEGSPTVKGSPGAKATRNAKAAPRISPARRSPDVHHARHRESGRSAAARRPGAHRRPHR